MASSTAGLAPPPPAGLDHRDDQGQQGPGEDVVDRRTGQGEGPDLGALHPALGEDPGQHREGGDRHRRADEEGEGQEVDALGQVGVPQDGGQAEAEGEREDDGGDRHAGGDPLLALDQLHVELEADHEHEDHQPELGQHLQVGTGLEREQGVADRLVEVEQLGDGARSEDERSEEQAGEDLAHDRRLADPAEQGAHEPRHDDDDHDVEEHPHAPTRGRARSTPPPAARIPAADMSCLQLPGATPVARPGPPRSAPQYGPSGLPSADHPGSGGASPPPSPLPSPEPSTICGSLPHKRARFEPPNEDRPSRPALRCSLRIGVADRHVDGRISSATASDVDARPSGPARPHDGGSRCHTPRPSLVTMDTPH